MFHQPSLKKNNIGWPQQPLTEKVSYISKNWIFDDSFHKKELVLVIWVLRVMKSSGSVIYFDEMRLLRSLRPLRLLRPLRSLRLQRF